MIDLTLCTGQLRQFASLYSQTPWNLLPSSFVSKLALRLLFDFSETEHKVVTH